MLSKRLFDDLPSAIDPVIVLFWFGLVWFGLSIGLAPGTGHVTWFHGLNSSSHGLLVKKKIGKFPCH